MKKGIALLWTLMLLCTAAWAEPGEEILFLDIPWLSTMEEVQQLLTEKGFIDENGAGSFDSARRMMDMTLRPGRSRNEGVFDAQGHIQTTTAPGLQDVTLMSGRVLQPWHGRKIHHVTLSFAWNGETTRLIHVSVSLVPDRTDVLPELKSLYGKPERNGKRDTFWRGGNGTGALFTESEMQYGLLGALDLLTSPEVQSAFPTPVPTATQDPLSDMLAYSQKGVISLLDIPWNTEYMVVLQTLVDRGVVSDTLLENPEKMDATSGMYIQANQKGTWDVWSSWSEKCRATYIWTSRERIRKTFGSFQIRSIWLTFASDGDEMRLKTAQITLDNVRNGNQVRTGLKEKLIPLLGEPTEKYGSLYWKDSQDNVMIIGGLANSCQITIGCLGAEEILAD